MPIKNWTPERLARKHRNHRRWRDNLSTSAKIKSRNYQNSYNRYYIISRRAKSLASRFGQHVSYAYLSYANKPGSKLAIGLQFIKDLCLPVSVRSSSKNVRERIHLLNDLSGSHFGNIGWSCRLCSISSNNPAFFDIDHILPRHKSGSSSKKNLQPLCPNCHRLKTIPEHAAWRESQMGRDGTLMNHPSNLTALPVAHRPDGQPTEKEIPSEDFQLTLF